MKSNACLVTMFASGIHNIVVRLGTVLAVSSPMRILFLFAAISVTVNAQNGSSGQPYFQEDPYLPFINYDSSREELNAFQEYYGVTEKPITNESFEKQLTAMMRTVYDGYKKTFPRFMQNKAMPHALIRDDDSEIEVVAFVSRREDLNQGILFVSRGFLASAESVDVKLGILAHEFGHLFFGDKGRKNPAFDIHYASGRPMNQSEISGFESWLELSQKLGLLLLPESGSLTKDSDLARFIEPVFNEMLASRNPNCGRPLMVKLAQNMQIVLKLYSPFQWDFIADAPEEKQLLSKTASDIENLVHACTANESFSPIKIPGGVARIFRKYGVASDLPWEDGLNFDQWFRAAREGKQALRHFAEQFDLKDVRYLSFEDRADRAAVRVLKTLGRNPTQFVDSFLFVLHNDKDRCLNEIKNGNQIPFGNPADVHHSVCYRLDQIRKFDQSDSQIPGLE